MEIHQEYLKRAQAIVDKHPGGNIFKADANNEAFGYPTPLGIVGGLKLEGDSIVYLLECNKDTAEFAKKKFKKYPNFVIKLGDIRHIPLKPESVTTILDLSTLDHISIKDVPQVFDEYKKLLAPSGSILVICWVSDKKSITDETEERYKEWKDDNQYYFNPEEVRRIFESRFKLINVENFTQSVSEYLLLMEGVKE